MEMLFDHHVQHICVKHHLNATAYELNLILLWQKSDFLDGITVAV